MTIPKKNRNEICKYLFKEGVLYAKKDYNRAKHPQIGAQVVLKATDQGLVTGMGTVVVLVVLLMTSVAMVELLMSSSRLSGA